MTPIFASSIGQIAHPFYLAMAWALAGFYSLVPNYAVAIALLTIAVMILVFPITRRGARSMMKMQLLAPEVKKLQGKYKAQPGMTVAERQELRQRMNEELMALYKENDTSPTGGCLPMFLQFPIFILLYGTIRGLTHSVAGKVAPLYLSHTSRMYLDIKAANGHLDAFGINLADSVRSAGLSWPHKIPYIALILIAIALQYIQMKQLSGRNPAAAAANPQMQQMQKVMPIIFAFIYISIPAGVNTYFIISSIFRICQQEFMYRRDPQLQASMAKLRDRSVIDVKATKQTPAPAGSPRSRWPFAKLALPAAPVENGTNGTNDDGHGKTTPPRSASMQSNARRQSGRRPATVNKSTGSKSQPRAQGKRPRKPR